MECDTVSELEMEVESNGNSTESDALGSKDNTESLTRCYGKEDFGSGIQMVDLNSTNMESDADRLEDDKNRGNPIINIL